MSPNGSSLDARKLAELEEGAIRYLRTTRSLRIEPAETRAEKMAVYRLRCYTVLEAGWGTPDQFPDGIEQDEYDEGAVHIAVWDGHTLAAANRLVFPVPGRVLPTAAAFDLSLDSVRGMVDWSRTCVAPPYRGRHREVLIGLITRTWLELRAHGFTDACGVLSLPMQRLYRRMGFTVEQLGAPRPHWGECRYPVRVGPPSALPSWLSQTASPSTAPVREDRRLADDESWSEEEPACPAGSSTR